MNKQQQDIKYLKLTLEEYVHHNVIYNPESKAPYMFYYSPHSAPLVPGMYKASPYVSLYIPCTPDRFLCMYLCKYPVYVT